MALTLRELTGFNIKIKDATYPWDKFRTDLKKSLGSEPTFSSNQAVVVVDCAGTLIDLNYEPYPGSIDFLRALANNAAVGKLIVSSGGNDSLDAARTSFSNVPSIQYIPQDFASKGQTAIDNCDGGILLPLVIEDSRGIYKNKEFYDLTSIRDNWTFWFLINLDSIQEGDPIPTTRLTLPFNLSSFSTNDIESIGTLIPYLMAQARSAS